jgi:maltose alpha-D-glucosyltransferase/alpha-amylase
MTQSFHYAAKLALGEMQKAGALGERSFADVEPFADLWYTWSSWAYLKGYLDAAGTAPFVPADHHELQVLLDAFRLERALWELEYDFFHRPDLLHIPMSAIAQIIDHSSHE